MELNLDGKSKTRQLKLSRSEADLELVMVGARLDGETGWLAWGLNLGPEPRMVGTQALIGIKQTNGSFLGNTYNVTQYIKIGCNLLPTPIDLNVSNLTFGFLGHIQYHIIEATIYLPQTVDISRIKHVWQVGIVAIGMEPKFHEKTLKNYDSTEIIDLQTGTSISIRSARRHQARVAHGILSIIGWGVILPIGVIIARYFKKGPIHWNEHDQWKHAHKACQACGYIFGVTGWAIGLWLGNYSKYYSFPKHGAYGISIFTFATLQTLALRLKPHKNDELHTYWMKKLERKRRAAAKMGVFTFVCKGSGDKWSAEQLKGDLEASASCTYDLQRKLVQAALASDSSGGVQSSFSFVTPSSAVFQVIIGGGGGGGGSIGGGAAAASSGGAAAAEAAPAEEKKEEKEESDDDLGFSLFD
ncbi:hypothetical protein KY285_029951 [Solanum tuberosum]|nr:hypothetical protein KY285_029951 [Solanum tuberosum]